jgi:hypothetical protein
MALQKAIKPIYWRGFTSFMRSVGPPDEIFELELHASNRFDFHFDLVPLALFEISDM